jgi:hypothetical protein
MLWDDDDDAPSRARDYGSHPYGYDDDDDERELMQRTCDCIAEHRPGLVCGCVCHPRKPDAQQRGVLFDSDGTMHVDGVRWICADCYVGDHDACDGLRANGEPCECRKCGDAAEGGA